MVKSHTGIRVTAHGKYWTGNCKVTICYHKLAYECNIECIGELRTQIGMELMREYCTVCWGC